MNDTYVLTLSCPNRPGIVAAVSTHLFKSGCNILDANQFDDTESGRFFMRVVFNPVAGETPIDDIRATFAPIAQSYGMDFTMRARYARQRVLLSVSVDQLAQHVSPQWISLGENTHAA